ncbi:phytoene desaturase family protein [Desulfotomaculum copahuensis]|uniref:phytoene desaturase family protein n=1 Tax=Desulfotomaculum copahuensis TaxID=1838280 RepID=UPI000B229CA8|nr:NAD(P)/FAD-dependent oxidoreductase [Desulfotomaculum copahuensis]
MKKIIIIGSGIGGLTAGNLLAQKGHDVTIFESHRTPGGYTAGFCRNGFYFESGTFGLEASATVFKAMKDIGVYNRIEFVRHQTRWVAADFDGVPGSYSEFKEMLYSAYPREKQGLDGFFKETDRMVAAMGDMDKPIPYLYSGVPYLVSIFSYLTGAIKNTGVMKKYGNMTTSGFAGIFFEKDSKLYRMFSRTGYYADMAAFLIAGAISGIIYDYWTVKGGMQSWADILADNFQKQGGRLLPASRVERIITKDGAAAGVLCNGEKINADYIIAACDYKKTMLNLLDQKNLISEPMREKIKTAPVSEGVFTVYLGLNMPAEEMRGQMLVPHVIFLDLNSNYDITDSADERFFEKTSFNLYSPSMVNQDLAPLGKSSLMLQTTVPFQWMQNWGGGNRELYRQLKYKAMETMIDRAEAIIPGLKGAIDYKDAATPLTYEKFTHNTAGATSAFSWNPKKRFYKNTMGIEVKTPVKNLLIGSCWANQIGGVPGAISAAYRCAHIIR